MGEAEPRRWRRAVVGALAAIVVTIPAAALGVAWSDHNDRGAEFRSARKDCIDDITDTVTGLMTEERAARERALKPPPPADPTDLGLINSINKVQTICFSPPLLPSDSGDGHDFHAQAFVVTTAWVASDNDLGAGDGTSYEESLLQGSVDYFSKSLPEKIHALREPSLWESLRALIPV
jgi:hypothetical protein